MSAFYAEIVSFLSSQPGVLPMMLKKHSSLGNRIAAWFTGEKRILFLGGEPASGKSLLMGELVLRHNELVKSHPGLPASLALISYDQIHTLVCKRLLEICQIHRQKILPEGETHVEARKYITDIMRDMLSFATRSLPQNTLIIVEAPLISHRGEVILDEFTTAQVLIMFSPVMWMQVRNQEKQSVRERSAQALAMEQIHEALLKERGITFASKQDQDRALEEGWKKWVSSYDGMVLSWDPTDDAAGFEHTIHALEKGHIPPDPLEPQELRKYTTPRVEAVLETIQEPQVLAAKVFS